MARKQVMVYVCILIIGNGYVTCYGHCQAIHVKVGQRVTQGEVIATVGNTGHSTGPHLHFEIQKGGVKVNPLKFFAGNTFRFK